MAKLLIFIIRIYQRVISPWLVPSCRFLPSCSEYAILSLKKYGLFKGSYLAGKRILSCHPFGKKHGYDPVP